MAFNPEIIDLPGISNNSCFFTIYKYIEEGNYEEVYESKAVRQKNGAFSWETVELTSTILGECE